MPFNVTNTDDYILAEYSEGIDYWEILESISKIFLMPEFKIKNDIWAFRDDRFALVS